MHAQRTHAAALALYAVLTVALAHPLLGRMAEVVPADAGDPLLSVWTLWWNTQEVPFSAAWWNGRAFFPAGGTLALSDHRVGLGIIASPIIWLGGSPVAAYNVVFLLTFFLSAAAAYALCVVLTGRAGAAFLGGLVFGFNPFRAGHLAHIELLASYWLPIVLLALHQWGATRRARWLLLLGVALLMQALTSGYYFFYFAVVIGLWLVWFLPRQLPWRQYAALGVALIAPLAAISPVLLEYKRVHEELGLKRSITEIEELSADVVGLVTAPAPLALVDSPAAWVRPEVALYPGAVAVAIAIVALLRRREPPAPPAVPRWAYLRRLLLIAAAAATIAAFVPVVAGPFVAEWATVRLTISQAYKPLSIAFLFALLWLLTSPALRLAWVRHSLLAFYALATVALWLLALGPTARLLGHRVLYQAPYAWLMQLPGFDEGFRAPARFGMIAALTLAAAAALAFAQLTATRARSVRALAAGVLAAAIIAESWVSPFAVAPLPAPLAVPASLPAQTVIAEIPTGVFEDAAAMYRAIHHGRPIVNGLSGYDPPHYGVMKCALDDGDPTGLVALAAWADIAVFVARDHPLRARLAAEEGVRPIAITDAHDILLIERRVPPESATPTEAPVPVVALHTTTNGEYAPRMADADLESTWSTLSPQRGGEAVIADLGAETDVSGVRLEIGRHHSTLPRGLAVDVSSDGTHWTTVWTGTPAASGVRAALAQPRTVPLDVGFPRTPARFVQVRQVARSAQPWNVAEFRVLGRRRSS